MINRLTITLAGLVILASGSVSANWCQQSKTITHDFNGSELNTVQLRALAGELVVTPSDNGKIGFIGKVCTDKPEHLDKISVEVETTGRELTLTVQIPSEGRRFYPKYAYMDIELRLPANLSLAIIDSSGDIEVVGVSVSQIDDSSGHIRVENGQQDLIIDDSSGDITVRGNKGSLTMSDSSGDINTRDIAGDFTITSDSSGDINVDRIQGDTLIEGDSSGDIDLTTIEKNVTIIRDGSGSIDVRDVQGDVQIGSDGSGNVEIRGVMGHVSIGSKGSGEVFVADVGSGFSVKRKGNGNIRTRDIEGPVNIP